MATMDKFQPRTSGVRDPRDTKKRNGLFSNPPRAIAFGGRGSISKLPTMKGDDSSVGPISDRGKGGRR